jgi:outer membrane protein assembly factor BamA
MKKSLLLLLSLLISGMTSLYAIDVDTLSVNEEDIISKKEPSDTIQKKNKIRMGWTFGALPSVSYDADLGFQYGALTNIYFFGDGSKYPEYIHSFYVEASYTTKRYGVFRFFYDSKYLIPNHRFTVDVSYLPDAMCDFIGYNGYQSVYNAGWRDTKADDYITRAFYKFKRDLFRGTADIQGKLGGNWYWNAGIGVLGYNVGSVNLAMINKGKDSVNMLPTDVDGLYEKYVKWNIIKKDEATGGWHPYLRGGITYDSRDRQQNPTKGIYTDVFLTYSAAFGEQKEYNNLKLNATFRHYIPVYKDYINFSYRLALQMTTAGQSPFYMNSYWNTLYIQRVMYEALGGGNTLRGVLRNRILANGFAFANVELRFKVAKFDIKKEHFYIGLVPFVDAGMVTQAYELNKDEIIAAIQKNDPDFDLDNLSDYIDFDEPEVFKPHFAAGMGLKVAMNDNFVLSVDWAMPLDKRDNVKMANLYIKIGYMF